MSQTQVWYTIEKLVTWGFCKTICFHLCKFLLIKEEVWWWWWGRGVKKSKIQNYHRIKLVLYKMFLFFKVLPIPLSLLFWVFGHNSNLCLDRDLGYSCGPLHIGWPFMDSEHWFFSCCKGGQTTFPNIFIDLNFLLINT